MLQRQLDASQTLTARQQQGSDAASPFIANNPTSATSVRGLPRFDITIMENLLDDQRSVKDEVYELFRQHPELLVPEVEALTKGRRRRALSQPLPILAALACDKLGTF
jgi:hypothetical protein